MSEATRVDLTTHNEVLTPIAPNFRSPRGLGGAAVIVHLGNVGMRDLKGNEVFGRGFSSECLHRAVTHPEWHFICIDKSDLQTQVGIDFEPPENISSITAEYRSGLETIAPDSVTRVNSILSLGYYDDESLRVFETGDEITQFEKLRSYTSEVFNRIFKVLKSGGSVVIVAGPLATWVILQSVGSSLMKDSYIRISPLSNHSFSTTPWSIQHGERDGIALNLIKIRKSKNGTLPKKEYRLATHTSRYDGLVVFKE